MKLESQNWSDTTETNEKLVFQEELELESLNLLNW